MWLYRWASFLIVFVFMVLVAGLFGFLGYRRVKKLRKPEKTIDSLKQASTVLPNQHESIPGIPGYKK